MIVVDSRDKHVVFAPFELLEPGMRMRKVLGIDNYHFHVLDRQSKFARYTAKWSKKTLEPWVDNIDKLFASLEEI